MLGTVFPVGFRAAEPSRVMRDRGARLPRDRGRRARARAGGREARDPPDGRSARPAGHRRGAAAATRDRRRPSLGRVVLGPAAFPRPQPGHVPVGLRRTSGRRGDLGRPAAGGRRPAGDPRHRRQDGDPPAAASGRRAARPRHRGGGARSTTRSIVGAGPAGLAAAVYGASEGLQHDRGRAAGARRPGRDLLADRELPRLPLRRVGRRARQPRAAAGAPARRRDPRHPRDRAHRRRRRARSISTAATSSGRARSSSRAASRGGSSRSTASTASPGRASPTARRAARRRPRTAWTSTSSARATRPARPRCSSRPTPAASRILCRGDGAREEHVALPASTSSTARAEHPHAARQRGDRGARRRVARGDRGARRGSGETTRLDSGGLYIFIGADAQTDWLPPEIALDEQGYVLTGSDMRATGAWTLAATPTSSRPACRASSPAATSDSARSSASPRRSARAAWPSPSSTSTSRTPSTEPGGSPLVNTPGLERAQTCVTRRGPRPPG